MRQAQRSFEDLGTPLIDVTFCVLDLETTGASPSDCAITEIGAVKVRGGELLGTFHTLINPGVDVPPSITYLTGITQAMVLPAPRMAQVLPSLLEFIGDSVIVGHNVRFDLSFLRAALNATGRPNLPNRFVDTCALARRLVRDEVPNCQLGTLADRLRLSHQPSHRALDDALATTDLLHLLLERAGTLGVTGLDDLAALPSMSGHAQAGKLKLTTGLPRSPGVYLFRDRRGQVLYVGKAANLRARVRSYFSSDSRRKIGQLLRETTSVDHIVCAHPLEAAVREVRLIHELRPRFNRQARDWEKYRYVKLTLNERLPRLVVARVTRDDGALYLGPVSSMRAARTIIEAVESVVPLGAGTAAVAVAQRALTDEPELVLDPLRARMTALAMAERYEEAAGVRDRAAALAGAVRRQRRIDMLVRAGRVVVEIGQHGSAEVRNGRLVLDLFDERAGGETQPSGPIGREHADEMACVASFIEQAGPSVRLIHSDTGLHLSRVAWPQ